MKTKKRLFAYLAAACVALGGLTACGGNQGDSPATAPPASNAAETTNAPSADGAAPANELSPVTLEVYSQPANFQGEQPGWTAKILKDRFNITLNIIAPQAAGSDIFAARSAAGFLGDLVVLDNVDIQSCITAGLLVDFTDEMKSLGAFDEYKAQLDYYNSSLDGVNDGQYYAWPTELANTSPTTFTPLSAGSPGTAPTVPWDYYKEIGAPELNNLTDLIGALKQMQDAHPTNDAGESAYGITLWPDWDGTSIENVNQLTKWYGQEVNGSILLDVDGNMVELTDDNGAYKKILQFYFDANNAGIVDPDSGTQNWDSVNQKFLNRRAYLIWNDWQQGFWNTSERGKNGENYIMAPVGDMKLYQPSDSFYGTGRAFACGTNDSVKKERVRMLMEWMTSHQGINEIMGGIKGYTYVDSTEFPGAYDRTVIGENALGDKNPIPDEYGGGTYADGMLQINQWTVSAVGINPETGYGFDPRAWPLTLKQNAVGTLNEWSERFGATSPFQYLVDHNLTKVVPYVNVNLAADTSDISVIRTTCGPIVCDASWKMIFAKDQAEFDSLWTNLKTDLDGFGWKDLVKFDMEKYKALVDERAKALQG
ncbi:MAG: sugar ABC transporter substrate-binding protein [Clostridiales bacterium]|jgi:multiple sugar transport system substrate-binding protein/putative aldouronate transport system substrate-binding protein|nr:sugar ABC transporter substrate-binding protein [Clostridiales bacterium]